MLRLRADVPADRYEELIEKLGATAGIRRLTSDGNLASDDQVIVADIESLAADDALRALRAAGLNPGDYVMVEETILPDGLNQGGISGSGGYSWTEIVGEARANSRPVLHFFLMMAVAGWIAGLGVVSSSTILIIGAMAVSPDLMPICSTSVGIVGRHFQLAVRSIATLAVGMATVMLLAGVVSVLLILFGVIDSGFDIRDTGIRGLAHVSFITGLIALGAGVAAILSFETRSASAVGVAISVTTVPASAYFGVAVALGEASEAWGALLVLVLNQVMLTIGGSITLYLQRRYTPLADR